MSLAPTFPAFPYNPKVIYLGLENILKDSTSSTLWGYEITK